MQWSFNKQKKRNKKTFIKATKTRSYEKSAETEQQNREKKNRSANLAESKLVKSQLITNFCMVQSPFTISQQRTTTRMGPRSKTRRSRRSSRASMCFVCGTAAGFGWNFRNGSPLLSSIPSLSSSSRCASLWTPCSWPWITMTWTRKWSECSRAATTWVNHSPLQFNVFTFVFCIYSVLHRHLCHWGDHETDGHESQILFPGGLEHLWFHHRCALPARAGAGGCSGPISVAFFSFGKQLVQKKPSSSGPKVVLMNSLICSICM